MVVFRKVERRSTTESRQRHLDRGAQGTGDDWPRGGNDARPDEDYSYLFPEDDLVV
jgi:hypothetical protein